MARAKDVAKLLRGGVNDKTSPARLAEIMKALRHAEIAKGITPEKLVSLLEELGPTFIKLGQILSARSDMLPQEYCNALQTLRSSTTPEPFSLVERRLRDLYDGDWHDVFSDIARSTRRRLPKAAKPWPLKSVATMCAKTWCATSPLCAARLICSTLPGLR